MIKRRVGALCLAYLCLNMLSGAAAAEVRTASERNGEVAVSALRSATERDTADQEIGRGGSSSSDEPPSRSTAAGWHAALHGSGMRAAGTRSLWGEFLVVPETASSGGRSADSRAAPANDNCEDAVEILLSAGGSITVQGDSTGATVGCPLLSGPTGFRDVWFKIATQETLTISVDYCGTMPPFMLFHPMLVTDCPCQMSMIGASGTDSATCGDGNWTVFWDDLPAGVYYWPMLTDAMVGSEGPYTVTFTAFQPEEYTCPEDSLLSQPGPQADDPWLAFLSGTAGDNENTIFERVTTTELVSGVQWWGLRMFWNSAAQEWEPCGDTTDFEFEITFYENGWDNLPGRVVASYQVNPVVTDLGPHWGDESLFQFNVDGLTPCPLLTDGWISIKALPSVCSFGWVISMTGPELAQVLSDDGEIGAIRRSMSLCLTGGDCPALSGACCLDATTSCTDQMSAAECLVMGGRFEPDTICDDLDPPCGELLGACCMPDATCQTTTIGDCDGNWLGFYTTCDMCPCIVPCPAGGVAEPEACGEDLNGGCLTDPPAFTPISCGDTICGTIWADGGQRDADWYQIHTTEWQSFTWAVECEMNFEISIIQPGPNGCADALTVNHAYGGECEPLSITSGALPPGEYWFGVHTWMYGGDPCEQPYTATLSCDAAQPDYCQAIGNCHATISRVQIGSIDNETVCEQYQDYTHLSAYAPYGGSMPLLVDFFCPDGAVRLSAWVDWNRDLAFDANELVGTYTGNGTYAFDVAPPEDAVPGPVRMRIGISDGYDEPRPCGMTVGEVEDYTLNVVELPGACCLAGGSCNTVLPSECAGVYAGPFTVCANNDCNNNGVDDFCDIAGASSNDCNGNGVPDECDIADCPAGDPSCADCQGNGVPDECELDDGVPAYQVDDGAAEDSVGLTAGGYWCWFNHFEVTIGAGVLTQVQVAYGQALNGDSAMIYVWSDPTQDGDPADAQVMLAVESTVAHANTGTFVTIEIPPTEIGPVGTHFFVGVLIQHTAGYHPALIDLSSSSQRSWLCGSIASPVDPNDLDSSTLATIDSLGYPGNWLIRADSINSRDCNANLIPDDCERDCNGNGIPDDCELCGDLDSDDDVDYDDYVIFLEAFGGVTDGVPAEDWCCDYDDSGAVGMADFDAWLACYRSYVNDPLAGPPTIGKRRIRVPLSPLPKRGFSPAPSP